MSPEPAEGEDREVSGAARRRRAGVPTARPRALAEWAAANRLKASVLAGACVLAIGGSAALWLLWAAMLAPGQVTVQTAMDALDRQSYDEVREMAQTLRREGVSPEDPLGAVPFLLGAAAAYEADRAWNVDKEPLYLVAARYLEEARDLGFPPGREGEGLFLLGWALYSSGQLPACRPVFREALAANPRRQGEIHRLLADAYLRDANPKLPEALGHNTRHLADPGLSQQARCEGLLQRARILLELGEAPECLATLDRIPSAARNYGEAIVTRGQVLMREARTFRDAPGAEAERRSKAVEKYHAAIEAFRLAQGRSTLAYQASSRATYLIGVCYVELEDYRAALSQLERTRKKYADTPEALAADFQIAEISRRLGRDQEALGAYGRLLGAVGDVRQYSNPWLSLDALRAGMLKAYQHYRDAESFENCLQLVRLLDAVFSRARTIELLAETYQRWGHSLLARAVQLPLGEAEPLVDEGHSQLRRAGRAYEQLAKLRVLTKHYADDLWDSAECYREGQGYEKTIELLNEYLKNQSRRRHPRALLHLGQALLAVGRLDEALDVLDECVAFHPRDAASFRARLAASHARLEKGQLEEARALLEANLYGGSLSPDSQEWRESLFSLGRLLHLAGRYEEAAAPLQEMVDRYPDAPPTIEVRYLLADCCRRRANLAEEKLSDDLVNTARAARLREVSNYRQAALEQYRQAQQALNRRQQVTELRQPEKSILRNCYFSIGGILFDLGQYDGAIKAYYTAANRYQNVPAVLEAYTQIARAYGHLEKPDEARRALEQAKVVLGRIKDNDDFDRTTIYPQKQWHELLDWLSSS